MPIRTAGKTGRGGRPTTARLGKERIRPDDANADYRSLAAIFERHVSPLMAHATLSSAAAQLGTSPAELTPGMAPRLVERAMVGVRLFCDRERLPTLMVDLLAWLDDLDARGAPPSG